MKKQVLGKCPVCHNELEVTKLSCPDCHINIEGNFTLCRFCKLSKEQIHFLEAFIMNRGNIKEIEKDLGISYPTVRNKLEDLIKALGFEARYSSPKIDKEEIIRKLEDGEITTEEAIKILKGEK